jgi:hypothetical protein
MTAPELRKKARRRKGSTKSTRTSPLSGWARLITALGLVVSVISVAAALILDRYTLSLQWPARIRFQSPLVISLKSPDDVEAWLRADQQGRRLTAYQEYACRKFGPACRVALAIQRAENPKGACEIYHYNSNGTLDWGYFQINTVHLQRPGLNLRDLLDCKANIDFAYVLYRERGFEPWSTYNSGAYRQFLHDTR